SFVLRGRRHHGGARPAQAGGRPRARRRHAKNRRARQAGAVSPSQGFLRHPGRVGAGVNGGRPMTSACAACRTERSPWTTMLAFYCGAWWIVRFTVLPFGVRGRAEEGTVTAGTDPAAPVMPRLVRVVVCTTIVTAVLCGVCFWLFLTR